MQTSSIGFVQDNQKSRASTRQSPELLLGWDFLLLFPSGERRCLFVLGWFAFGLFFFLKMPSLVSVPALKEAFGFSAVPRHLKGSSRCWTKSPGASALPAPRCHCALQALAALSAYSMAPGSSFNIQDTSLFHSTDIVFSWRQPEPGFLTAHAAPHMPSNPGEGFLQPDRKISQERHSVLSIIYRQPLPAEAEPQG